MQNIIRLRTAYLNDLAIATRKRRACAWIGSGLIIAGALALMLLFSGCKTTGPAIGPVALQASTTLATEFALSRHPEITPHFRVATLAVCSVSAGTNIAPGAMVEALNKAGVTNLLVRDILNGVLATYNVAYTFAGTNLDQFKPYADALCQGLTLGLPSEDPTKAMAKHLPPHL